MTPIVSRISFWQKRLKLIKLEAEKGLKKEHPEALIALLGVVWPQYVMYRN
jgi:hypothetical protein